MSYLPRVEQSLEEIYPNLDVDAPIEISIVNAQSSGILQAAKCREASVTETDDNRKTDVPIEKHQIAVPPKSYVQFGVSGYIGGLGTTPRHLPLKHTLSTPKPIVRNQKVLDANLGYVNPRTSYNSKFYVRPDASMEIYRPFTNMLPQDPLNLEEHLTKYTQVEYDIDEADLSVLGLLATRFGIMLEPELFEVIMSMLDLAAALLCLNMYHLEKQAALKCTSATVDGSRSCCDSHGHPLPSEENRHCAVCNYAECTDSNTIVFCDGCDVAVHQDCYGVHSIPEGRWLCRRCEIKGIGAEVDCYLCPRKSGAFKRSTGGNWVHMVCALWTPIAYVPDNTSFLEPIRDLEFVDRDRWSLRCYVCQQKQGACIQCAARDCYSAFHPTCAQAAGFYMTNYDYDIGEMIKHQNFLPVYCHRHSQAHAPRGFPPPKLDEARRLLAEERQKLISPGISLFEARKYKYWRTSNRTLILPHAVVKAVMASAKTLLDLDLEQDVVEFLCRYWTIKKDSLDGVMFNRRMHYALEVAERRIVRAEQSEECLKTPMELISIVEELLAVLKSPNKDIELSVLQNGRVSEKQHQKVEDVHFNDAASVKTPSVGKPNGSHKRYLRSSTRENSSNDDVASHKRNISPVEMPRKSYNLRSKKVKEEKTVGAIRTLRKRK